MTVSPVSNDMPADHRRRIRAAAFRRRPAWARLHGGLLCDCHAQRVSVFVPGIFDLRRYRHRPRLAAGACRSACRRSEPQTSIEAELRLRRDLLPLGDFGAETVGSTPAELDAFRRAEIAKWKKVAAQAKLSLD